MILPLMAAWQRKPGRSICYQEVSPGLRHASILDLPQDSGIPNSGYAGLRGIGDDNPVGTSYFVWREIVGGG